MDLKSLVAKPQLKKILIDDEDTVKEYGEPLEFYVWDRQPVETFMKLADMDKSNFSKVVELVNELILDKDAVRVVEPGMALPQTIYIKAIEKVVAALGE